MEENKFLENYKTLPITNYFMFGKVMSDEETCKQFLETILKIKVEKLTYIESEVTRKFTPNSKGVRYDVYVKDSDRIFDIEVQMADTKELQLRARYYQSIMDIDNLYEGNNYTSLRESYVIFICPIDIFGSGLPIYTFENRCVEELSLKMNDKTKKIYYNFSEYEKVADTEIKALLKYFSTGKSESGLTDRLKDMLERAQTNHKWGMEYMLYEMDLQNRYEQGVEYGANAQYQKDCVIIAEQANALAERDSLIAERDNALLNQANLIAQLQEEIRLLKS